MTEKSAPPAPPAEVVPPHLRRVLCIEEFERRGRGIAPGQEIEVLTTEVADLVAAGKIKNPDVPAKSVTDQPRLPKPRD